MLILGSERIEEVGRLTKMVVSSFPFFPCTAFRVEIHDQI